MTFLKHFSLFGAGRAAVATCCFVGLAVTAANPAARADTPTVTDVATSVVATSVPVTVVASPEPQPTSTVVLVKERPKPTSSPLAVVPERPAPLATSLPTPLVEPTTTRLQGQPTSTSVNAATPVVATPTPEVSLPSPDDLRRNAAIRWGKHVPRAVRRWAYIIVPTAKRYHLNPNLIAAVMTLESGGNPRAWNQGSDARGLMQVLHGPWDPQQNIDTGAHMLADFYSQFGDWTLTLAAYNAGPNAVIANHGVPPYRETRDYVIVVSYLWDLYSHRTLTVRRRVQFRSTLKDLERFPRERSKVKRLSKISKAPVDRLPQCLDVSCGATPAPSFFPTLDPFWPVGGSPDPLQKVDPYTPS